MSQRLLTIAILACAVAAGCETGSASLAERSRAAREARQRDMARWAAKQPPDEGALTRHALAAESGAVAQAAATAQESSDMIAALEGIVMGIVHTRDSVERLLEEYKGTPRADSTVLRFHGLSEIIVSEIARELEDSAWQPILLPTGDVANRRRRQSGRGEQTADSAELATADSAVRFLLSRGVFVWDGEGRAYLSASEEAIRDRFGPFVTAPMREYLDIVAIDQKAPLASDGGLGVPMTEVAARMSAIDRLLAAHPRFAAAHQAEALLSRQLWVFLANWYTEPSFVGKPRTLDPGARQRYESFAAANQGSRSGKVMRDYLSLLASSSYRETPETKAFLESLNQRISTSPPYPLPDAMQATGVRITFREQPEYVEADACAGELCAKISGEQVAYETISLYERPDTTSRLLARLAPPVHVTVLGMELHSRPAPFLVRHHYEGYLPGDTLWILNDLGEDHYRYRRGTEPAVEGPLWFEGGHEPRLPLCASVERGRVPPGRPSPTCWGMLLAPLRIASWFRFRTQSGLEGWAIPRGMDGGLQP